MYRLPFVMSFVLVIAVMGSDSAESRNVAERTETVTHQLKVTLHPSRQSFEAEDRITVPQSLGRTFSFVLHQGLNPVCSTPHVTVVRESESPGQVPLVSYRVSLPAGVKEWVLNVSGPIHHPLELHEREKVRDSRSTPGLISKEGVFLSGESYWYPQFGEDFLSFDLEVILPQDWDAVSQGERTLHEIRGSSRRVRWQCAQPQQEISLVAGPFFEFSQPAGKVFTMVFLREPDKALAGKYLDATARYLALYDRLIGAYPYGKFALVENHWETGYGMPSFALMGSKVIRFPFIIFSSFPHEVLHNWWGNSVYPDLKTGNWCEGLTAYMADHVLRELRGTASEYRRDTLQRYTDYVSKENDVPLCQFRSRHSAATQAIGYGKALMFFHMLRMQLGDAMFREGLREFFQRNLFRLASYDDIRRSLEAVSGTDLSRQFAQWVTRAGAPQLKVSNPSVRRERDRYIATVEFDQIQPGEAFRLHVPVAITVKGQDRTVQTQVLMTDKRHEFHFTVPHAPVRIDVDPEFDVFRRLAKNEVPPALTQVFGAERLTIVVPRDATPALRSAFTELARQWHASGPEVVETIDDDDMTSLPSDRCSVILGWENRFSHEVRERLAQHHVTITEDRVTVGDRSFPPQRSIPGMYGQESAQSRHGGNVDCHRRERSSCRTRTQGAPLRQIQFSHIPG